MSNYTQFEYRESASRLHKAVGEVLRTSPLFKYQISYQEYPVKNVDPEYNFSHYFDWVIPGMFLVIECMGIQHEKIQDFSGHSEDAGISAFKEQKVRDKLKKAAAINNGWTYVEISYKDEKKITDEFIMSLYKKNYNDKQVIIPAQKKETDKTFLKIRRDNYLKSDKHKKDLQLAKQYRHEQYLKNKKRK